MAVQKRELFCEIWTLLGKRRQPTDGRENTPFRLNFPPLSGKTTSLQDYIKTITLAEKKLKGVFMRLTMILAVGRVLGRNFYECLV